MKINRRVDQGIDSLVGWVESEAARHVGTSLEDYKVFMKMEISGAYPVINVMLTSPKRPGNISSEVFSLYRSSPWFRHNANSRTAYMMDGAEERLIKKKVSCETDPNL